MIFSVNRLLGGMTLCTALALSSCTPSSSASLEEEKEPHFLEGKSRVNSMDYAGAIESFEQALEVNPKSAAAHFEIGLLCDQREADPATAIYHYGRYLKLRPEGDKVDRARSRVMACKEQLARTVSLGPLAQALQHDYDVLAEQNKRLAEENKSLREKLERWEASAHKSAAAGQPPAQDPSGPAQAVLGRFVAPNRNHQLAGLRENPAPRPPGSDTRTHTVSPGETPMAIAKKYGIKLEALMAANPRLEPRRMRVGQTLAVPAI